MAFSTDVAEVRFGCGLTPGGAGPADLAALWARLTGPDWAAQAYPIATYTAGLPDQAAFRAARKAEKQAQGSPDHPALQAELQQAQANLRDLHERGFLASLQRSCDPRSGLRERLVGFWTDHFTARGKDRALRHAVPAYVEEAIRPHVTGRFADLLVAAVTHPLMLHYLDQDSSIGPGSPAATGANRARGLNENLAREVLELHTLGVGGPYSQADVRQLAEVFTGLAIAGDGTPTFRRKWAEPGSETVLGRTYGGDPAQQDHVVAVLRDLAVHPATARHLAWKLAVHFLADDPDPALVDHVAARFRDSGGDLLAVTAALLEHPAAWVPGRFNVRPPFDFLVAALRALGRGPAELAALTPIQRRRLLMRPLALMGQPWQAPGGPDGWPSRTRPGSPRRG